MSALGRGYRPGRLPAGSPWQGAHPRGPRGPPGTTPHPAAAPLRALPVGPLAVAAGSCLRPFLQSRKPLGFKGAWSCPEDWQPVA
eukprot:scaffold223548_cov37-Prasinocladus_malaysianus.AAC.1